MTNRSRKTSLHRTALFFGSIVVASLSLAHRALAQPRGEGPLVLRLPVSARYLAMGNAQVAGNDGDMVLANPGMLSVARGTSVSLQRYGSHATTGSFGTITTSGSLFVGIGAQFLDWSAPAGSAWPDALMPSASHLSDSGAVRASSSAFVVGVARTIKGFRLGASVKYAEDRIGADGDGTAAFDIGLTRPMGPANLAFVVQNLGAGARFAGEKGTLPRRIGLGWGGGLFPFNEYLDLGAQMQVTLEGDLFVRPAGGIEVGYVPIDGVAFVFRTGLRLPREKDEPLATGGLGIVIDRISLDYAMEPMRGGRPVSHRIGVRVR